MGERIFRDFDSIKAQTSDSILADMGLCFHEFPNVAQAIGEQVNSLRVEEGDIAEFIRGDDTNDTYYVQYSPSLKHLIELVQQYRRSRQEIKEDFKQRGDDERIITVTDKDITGIGRMLQNTAIYIAKSVISLEKSQDVSQDVYQAVWDLYELGVSLRKSFGELVNSIEAGSNNSSTLFSKLAKQEIDYPPSVNGNKRIEYEKELFLFALGKYYGSDLTNVASSHVRNYHELYAKWVQRKRIDIDFFNPEYEEEKRQQYAFILAADIAKEEKARRKEFDEWLWEHRNFIFESALDSIKLRGTANHTVEAVESVVRSAVEGNFYNTFLEHGLDEAMILLKDAAGEEVLYEKAKRLLSENPDWDTYNKIRMIHRIVKEYDYDEVYSLTKLIRDRKMECNLRSIIAVDLIQRLIPDVKVYGVLSNMHVFVVVETEDGEKYFFDATMLSDIELAIPDFVQAVEHYKKNNIVTWDSTGSVACEVGTGLVAYAYLQYYVGDPQVILTASLLHNISNMTGDIAIQLQVQQTVINLLPYLYLAYAMYVELVIDGIEQLDNDAQKREILEIIALRHAAFATLLNPQSQDEQTLLGEVYAFLSEEEGDSVIKQEYARKSSEAYVMAANLGKDWKEMVTNMKDPNISNKFLRKLAQEWENIARKERNNAEVRKALGELYKTWGRIERRLSEKVTLYRKAAIFWLQNIMLRKKPYVKN